MRRMLLAALAMLATGCEGDSVVAPESEPFLIAGRWEGTDASGVIVELDLTFGPPGAVAGCVALGVSPQRPEDRIRAILSGTVDTATGAFTLQVPPDWILGWAYTGTGTSDVMTGRAQADGWEARSLAVNRTGPPIDPCI